MTLFTGYQLKIRLIFNITKHLIQASQDLDIHMR